MTYQITVNEIPKVCPECGGVVKNGECASCHVGFVTNEDYIAEIQKEGKRIQESRANKAALIKFIEEIAEGTVRRVLKEDGYVKLEDIQKGQRGKFVGWNEYN